MKHLWLLIAVIGVVLGILPVTAAADATLVASADGNVYLGAPSNNYGQSTILPMSGTSYMKFDVPAAKSSATLRMRGYNSADGLEVRETSCSWTESGLTYSNAPAPGALISVVSVRPDAWVDVNVSPYVTGGGPECFALVAAGSIKRSLYSLENAMNEPRLVIGATVPVEPACSDGPDDDGDGLVAHPADPGCSSHTDNDEPNSGTDPAPNCIGEPADHPVVNYPEQRVFLEAQGWWDDRDDDGQVARFGDSEHLHIGTCFPLQKTVRGTVRLDMRVVGHNLPAGAKIDHTRFHDAGQKHYGDIRYDHVVANDGHDVTIWRKNVRWNSKQATDGLREIRFLTFVKRPDGAEIHASTGWCVNVQNGKKDSNDGSCGRRLTEGRGWYDCLEYKISRFDGWTYPYAGIPAGEPYSLPVTGQDGAPFGGGGDDAVTRHWLRVDPAFHSGTLGTLAFEHPGAHSNEHVTIPGSVLTPGIHRLFLMTERDGSCTNVSSGTVFPNQRVPQDGIISGGIAVPIMVTASKPR